MVVFYPSSDGKHKYVALITPEEWNAAHPNDKITHIKTIRFGGIKENGEPYGQYFDKIGHFSKYNNYDTNRRKNYRLRHSSIYMDDDGTEVPAYQYKYSPAWFSYNYLW
jgi:hypothetical protein